MKLIERTRWIIRRKDTGAIFCGLAQNFHFINVNGIGDVAIKTYRSKGQALAAFDRSWGEPNFEIEAVKVTESLEL